MVRLPSDNMQRRYQPDQPLVGHSSKATKAGRKPTGILMSPMTIANPTDIEVTRDFETTSEERV